ncbi:MAG: IS110 family RNA-guided transposase [Alphaproteobacteria bacterium]
MDEVIRIGLDTSKQVFQMHGVDAAERPVLRKTLRRGELERFFAALRPTVIGLEACGASHHWARVLRGLGHEVRLPPPQYVKPYVKRGKNDAADAEAIREALGRPSMRFVAVKTAENQAAPMLHGARGLLIKQRTMLANAIRGHAAEFGIAGAAGIGRLREVLERVAREPAVPALAREVLARLAEQSEALESQIAALDRRLRAWHQANERSRRLATIPGIGPIRATALAMKVADPNVFRSGRHFAAWLGLTPKDHSTAGRQRLGAITRAGDETLRCLLVSGAMAAIQRAKPGRSSPWLLALLARKPKKLAAVALANKTARIAWAVMMRGGTYQRPAVA